MGVSSDRGACRPSELGTYKCTINTVCPAVCMHPHGMILYLTHLLKRAAPRRYRKAIEASGEVRFGPSCFRVVPRNESGPRFPRRGIPIYAVEPLFLAHT